MEKTEIVITKAGCFACGKQDVGVRQDLTLRKHTVEGKTCEGSGSYCHPHYEPEARAKKVCSACGTANHDCDAHGCCDRCRLAEWTAIYENRPTKASKAVSAQYRNACPSCGAQGGEPCMTRSGKVTDTHMARVQSQ